MPENHDIILPIAAAIHSSCIRDTWVYKMQIGLVECIFTWSKSPTRSGGSLFRTGRPAGGGWRGSSTITGGNTGAGAGVNTGNNAGAGGSITMAGINSLWHAIFSIALFSHVAKLAWCEATTSGGGALAFFPVSSPASTAQIDHVKLGYSKWGCKMYNLQRIKDPTSPGEEKVCIQQA